MKNNDGRSAWRWKAMLISAFFALASYLAFRGITALPEGSPEPPRVAITGSSPSSQTELPVLHPSRSDSSKGEAQNGETSAGASTASRVVSRVSGREDREKSPDRDQLYQAQVLRDEGKGGSFNLIPNSLGLFPRIDLELEETVDVSLLYTQGQPGDSVIVQAEDGGHLNENRTVLSLILDEQRRLRFTFKTTREGGIYRVTLRRGFEEKRFEFYGGTASIARER